MRGKFQLQIVVVAVVGVRGATAAYDGFMLNQSIVMGIGTGQGIHQSLVKDGLKGIVVRNTRQLRRRIFDNVQGTGLYLVVTKHGLQLHTPIDLNHRSSSQRGFVRHQIGTQSGNPTTQNDNGSLFLGKRRVAIVIVVLLIGYWIILIIILGQAHGFGQGCGMHGWSGMGPIDRSIRAE